MHQEQWWKKIGSANTKVGIGTATHIRYEYQYQSWNRYCYPYQA